MHKRSGFDLTSKIFLNKGDVSSFWSEKHLEKAQIQTEQRVVQL
jgi:hypothetical protein